MHSQKRFEIIFKLLVFYTLQQKRKKHILPIKSAKKIFFLNIKLTSVYLGLKAKTLSKRVCKFLPVYNECDVIAGNNLGLIRKYSKSLLQVFEHHLNWQKAFCFCFFKG
jgi:hypothetical protein